MATSVIQRNMRPTQGVHWLLHRIPGDWSVFNTDAVVNTVQTAIKAAKYRNQLIWHNEDQAAILSTECSIEDALEAMGIDIDCINIFKWTKRMRRVLRPYNIYTVVKPDEIDIKWLPDDPETTKLHDGFGQISRKFLESISIVGHTPERIRAIKADVKRAKRVEFTVMTNRGIVKGHAIVIDDLDADMVLPCDIKTEVKFKRDEVFVGINVVHSSREALLDPQSLINMKGVFPNEVLLSYLQQYIDDYTMRISQGDFSINIRNMSAKQLEQMCSWNVMKFIVSGGDIRWSPYVTRQLMRMLVTKLTNGTEDNFRMPIPGAAAYIATSSVTNVPVPKGHAKLSHDLASLIINDDDWIEVTDILGGADGDDRVWVITCFDTSTQAFKVLYWRSPNEEGEWMVMDIAPGSDWALHKGDVPCFDLSKLPTRIDKRNIVYLQRQDADGTFHEGLINKTPLPSSHEWKLEHVMQSLQRAEANAGTLGGNINIRMTFSAMDVDIPALPAKVGDIVDSTVKDGYDLSAVKKWNSDFINEMVGKVKFPPVMTKRIMGFIEDKSKLKTAPIWIDALQWSVHQMIQGIEAKTDALCALCRPPIKAVMYGINSDLGAEIRTKHQEYAGQKGNGAFNALSGLFSRINPLNLTLYTLSGWIRSWTKADKVVITDSAFWVNEQLEEGQAVDELRPPISDYLIDALREINCLGTPIQVGQHYELQYTAQELDHVIVDINGVFFQMAKQALEDAKDDPLTWKNAVDYACGLNVSQQFKLGKGLYHGFLGAEIEIKYDSETGRYKAFMDNQWLGYLRKSEETRITDGDEYQIVKALQSDGNVVMVLKPLVV